MFRERLLLVMKLSDTLFEVTDTGSFWYHTTSPDRVASIMAHGLKANMPHNKSAGSLEWMHAAYGGIVPVFLSKQPGYYRNGTILKISVNGLALVADIPGLIDHGAQLMENGRGLWFDEEDTPEQFWSVINPRSGEVSFKKLRTPGSSAAMAAIDVTGTCAVLTPISPDRIEVIGDAQPALQDLGFRDKLQLSEVLAAMDESVGIAGGGVVGYQEVLESDDATVDEMAIQQFKTVGDWSRRSSFGSEVDRKLLTSPRAVEKIKRQWEKTPYDFDIYLVNDPRVNKSEFREVGLVGMDFVRNELRLTPEEIPDPDDNTITIIYTSNTGAQRYMASGWILAHRLGHALARGNSGVAERWRGFTAKLRRHVVEILEHVYGLHMQSRFQINITSGDERMLRYVAQELGSMKSARDGKLRNWFEFAYELLAQYMLTGGVKFNQLPASIVTGIRGWGRKERRGVRDEVNRSYYNEGRLREIEGMIAAELEGILGAAVGSVFVM